MSHLLWNTLYIQLKEKKQSAAQNNYSSGKWERKTFLKSADHCLYVGVARATVRGKEKKEKREHVNKGEKSRSLAALVFYRAIFRTLSRAAFAGLATCEKDLRPFAAVFYRYARERTRSRDTCCEGPSAENLAPAFQREFLIALEAPRSVARCSAPARVLSFVSVPLFEVRNRYRLVSPVEPVSLILSTLVAVRWCADITPIAAFLSLAVKQMQGSFPRAFVAR